MWRTAKLVLDSFGWKRSKKLEKLCKDMSESEDEFPDFDDLEFSMVVDTNARLGDFSSMLEEAAPAVALKANGRQVFWVDDPEDEWNDVILFFGDEGILVEALEAITARTAVTRRGLNELKGGNDVGEGN